MPLYLYTLLHFSFGILIGRGIAYSVAEQITGVIIAPGVIIIAVKLSCIDPSNKVFHEQASEI
jgi:hypothetical protein